MTRVLWITASPRSPTTGVVETVRLAGGGDAAPYLRNGVHFRAGVASEPRFSAELGFDENGWTGGTVASSGNLVFRPAQEALLSQLAGLLWNDAAITVDRGLEGGPSTTILTGTVAGSGAAEDSLVLTIADLSTALHKPVITARFAGTGGVEGAVEAADRVKRRSWGRVFNVEGRILDKANNIFEFGDPAFPCLAFDALRDKGRDAAPVPAVLAWQGSALATLNALKASVPAQGSGVVAPSICCAKWWTQPSGPLTADIRGEIGVGYVETAPEIAARIVAAVSGPAIANVGAMAGLRGGAAGWHIGDENETAAQALDRLLLGVSLLWVLEPTGVVRLREWTFANPVETIRSRKVTRLRTLSPIKGRRVGYQKSQRLHGDAEISVAIHQAEIAGLVDAIGTLEAAIDGKVTTFFQAAVPVAEGVGDLWFKTDTSKWHRWNGASWELTQDAGIGAALSAAAGAQATADGKVTTYNQQTQPAAPAIGDLWVQPSALPKVLRRWNGSIWAEVANLVTKGTDIGVADGATKNVIWYQPGDPGAAAANGDLWTDTDAVPVVTYVRQSGAWGLASNVVTQGAHIGVANGATKNTIWRQAADPAGAAANGDFWVSTGASPVVSYVRVAGAWEPSANLVTEGSQIGVANGAGTTLFLVDGGNHPNKGNVVTKAGADGWNGFAYSREAYPAALASGRLPGGTTEVLFGLSDNPSAPGSAGSAWDALNFAWLNGSDGIAYAWTPLAGVLSAGAADPNAAYTVSTDRVAIVWKKNGAVVRVAAAPTDGRSYGLRVNLNGVGAKVSDLHLLPATDNNWNSFGGTGLPETGADVTRNNQHALTVPPAQTIQYDFTATTTSQLPKVLQCTMKKGDLDVTSTTAFAYSGVGCSVDVAGLTAGQVRLNSVSAANAFISVSATPVGGAMLPAYIPVSRILSSPPATSGGASGASSFGPLSINHGISDTSYDGSPQELGRGQMRTSSSGQARLTLSGEYAANPGESVQVFAKAQRSTDGTTWTDTGVSVNGTVSTGSVYNTPPGQPIEEGDYQEGTIGTIAANAVVSGLAASTDHFFRWIAYKIGSTGSAGVSGTMSGSQP